MCGGCWRDYLDECGGRPAPITPQITEAVAAIRDLYEAHGTGGKLHVVVDDWNLEDKLIAFIGQEDMDHADERERACWAKLSPLTVLQRATALAMFDGFIV